MAEDEGPPAQWVDLGGAGLIERDEAWRLPTPLHVLGLISATVTILGIAAWVYLVEFTSTSSFGSLVDPVDESGYYSLLWVAVVACGAQLYSLIRRDVRKLWWSTIFRVVSLMLSILVSPALEFDPSFDEIQFLHLGVQAAILLVIRDASNRRQPAE